MWYEKLQRGRSSGWRALASNFAVLGNGHRYGGDLLPTGPHGLAARTEGRAVVDLITSWNTAHEERIIERNCPRFSSSRVCAVADLKGVPQQKD